MVLACLHSTGVQTVGLTHYLPTVLQSSKCDAGKNRIEGKLTSHGFVLKKGGKGGKDGKRGGDRKVIHTQVCIVEVLTPRILFSQ